MSSSTIVNKKVKIEKFFRLNDINVNYVDICNRLVPEEWLSSMATKYSNNNYTKETFKIFKSHLRDAIGELVKREQVEQENLSFEKFRQEANEHAINWFKRKIIENITQTE